MKITCEKCSAPYEIEDSRIPVSGFIMKCPACMHSFKVMRAGTPAAAAPPPASPAPMSAAPATTKYHVRRRTGKTFGPFVETAIVTMLQNGKLDGDEQVSTDGSSWLPLSAIPAFAPWAKPTGGEIEDLPAPKGPSPSGIVDLPAPKRPTPIATGIPDLPTAKPPLGQGIPDLPAPKRPVGMGVGGIPDLPAPKGAPGARPPAAKPAPSIPPARPAPPIPPAKPAMAPPPPPIGARGGIVDLPAPKGPVPTGIVDLPTPKGPTPLGIPDLPMPKGPTPSGVVDLPTPKGPHPTGIMDLPTPKGPAAFGKPSGLDDFDLAPVGGGSSLDLGEVDLPTPKAGFGDSMPPPPPALSLGEMDDMGGEAAIISSPGVEEMRSIPDSSIDVVAPRQSNQLHVDLDAVDAPVNDPSIDLVAPRGFPAPVADEPALGDIPELQAPRPAPKAPPRSAAVRSRSAAPQTAAAPDKRKKMLIMGAVFAGGLLIAGAAILVLKSMGVGGEKIDAVALAKLRGEIAADNYDVLLRVGQKIKLSAEAQPKNLEQHAMAAQVLSLAVVAHRGDPKQAKAADELMAAIDKNEANPEAVKARAAVAIAQNRPQEAEAMLTQLVGEAGKGGSDAFAQLLLAWAQLKGNRAKSAEATFQKALSLDGKLAGAAWGVALCREKAGDKAGMQQWVQKTLERSPAHFAANLAQARDKGEDTISGLLQLHGSKGSPAELADAWALVGSKQLAELRLDEADASFKKALTSDPTNLNALVGMGDTLFQLGRFVESKDKLDAAQKAAPQNVDVTVSMARTQLALGQPLLAQDLLQAAAKGAPKDARIRVLQGKTEETLDKEGAGERAQALYKQAIDLDPKLVEAYAAMAQQMLKVDRPDQAQNLAADALKNVGDTADVRTLIGTVLLAQNDPVKAQVEFSKALEKMPNHLAARMGLAGALEAQKKPDAALAELEKIRAKVPAYPGLSQRLGALYQALGRVDDAAKAYEAALAMPGANVGLKFSAANFFYGVQKCERARELTEQITNEDSKNSDAYELLARVHECNNRRDQAMLAIHHAIELSDKPQFHLTKAKLHEKADQGQDALVEYQIAADRGHLPDAYVGRAKLLLNLGSNKEALHDLELARKLDKNRCDALSLMGKGNLGLQNYKLAEGQLREATHCLPKDAEARYMLAEACTGAHDFPCACSAYREATQLGIKGDNLGDSYYKLGMCEKQRGGQGAASEAFKKCMEVGTEVQKSNCGKELGNLGGFK